MPIRSLIAALILMLSAAPHAALANQASRDLGVCFTDSLNGKERKVLATWIFIAMAAHDEIRPYTDISARDADDTNRTVGALITRLMARDCPDQVSAAFAANGSVAIADAFRIVGEVAMQELMTNPKVGQAIGAFEQYVDTEKVNALMK